MFNKFFNNEQGPKNTNKTESAEQDKRTKEELIKKIEELENRLKESEKSKEASLETKIEDIERYRENVIFVEELEPFVQKALVLFDMAGKLEKQSSNFYQIEKEKNNTSIEQQFNKALSKFQLATFNLRIGEWHEQLNSIVNNKAIMIPPISKGNTYSSCYGSIRQAIKEGKNENQRAVEFQESISVALFNQYGSALLVLIEDMMLLEKLGVIIPDTIKTLRTDIRTQLKVELELEINDVLVLTKSPKNSGIQEIDKIETSLEVEENTIIEIISYGIERKGTRVSPTKTIVSK